MRSDSRVGGKVLWGVGGMGGLKGRFDEVVGSGRVWVLENHHFHFHFCVCQKLMKQLLIDDDAFCLVSICPSLKKNVSNSLVYLGDIMVCTVYSMVKKEINARGHVSIENCQY